ncbi:hypothetical protein BC828DRAFT_388722 [Blastocladiella britannica]|nr:hypothetical protein BC828DRAFT_388722 [Blastocladiella britannica]
MSTRLAVLAILVLLLNPAFAALTTRLGLDVEQLTATAPGFHASITCLLPPSAPASYSCSGYARSLTTVLESFSTALNLKSLSLAAPIAIDAHYIPFCEETVDALDGDPARDDASHARACASALSHAGALAFAAAQRFWKVRETSNGMLSLAPIPLVKFWAGAGAMHRASNVADLDLGAPGTDILMQVRSDWDGWYFGTESTPIKPHQMDMRITMTHELLHALGVSFTGLDLDTAPGLALPWNYGGSSSGYWTNWTDATPWYMRHLVATNATHTGSSTPIPLPDLAARVTAWQPKSGTVKLANVGETLARDSPDAAAAARALHAAMTTPRALAFQTTTSNLVYMDTTAPNATANSATHLDSDTYGGAADDAILVLDTARYTGRVWNATLGPALASVLVSLGYTSVGSPPGSPVAGDALTAAAGGWEAVSGAPITMPSERIDVMGWRWNWVRAAPWPWVNGALWAVLGAAWVWLAKLDFKNVGRVREWHEMGRV